MSWKRVRKVLQRTLFFPSQANRDLDDEIRFHLAEETRLQSERGLADEDAAVAARRLFGNIALAKEETRAVWVSTRLEQCLQDLRFGCRILTRSPGVSLTATILIALVIGGNTTVFSIAHGVLAKPSAGVHAPRLATVSWVAENGDIETHQPYQVYTHFLRAQHRLSTDRRIRLCAPDDDARQRQLCRPRGNRLAELLRHTRRSPREGPELPRRRGEVRFGPRRRSRASHLAEQLRGCRRHRRTAGHRERPAGDGRRCCRGELSAARSSPSSPISGFRSPEKLATGCK